MRGSYAVSGEDFQRYGCNSTCCEIRVGGRILIFDAGSGIIRLGQDMLAAGDNSFSLYFTHFHVDHCYGMNYFLPLYHRSSTAVFAGPVFGRGSLKSNLEYITDELVHPVSVNMLPCRKYFVDIQGGETLGYREGEIQPQLLEAGAKTVGEVIVRTLHNPAHSQLGVINYRVEYEGKAVVFATDVECDPAVGYDRALAEFARGADLLLLDGQYTDQEYEQKKGWGHSTCRMACYTALVAGVQRLLLIHHDPFHDDEFLDNLGVEAETYFSEVSLAREGEEIVL